MKKTNSSRIAGIKAHAEDYIDKVIKNNNGGGSRPVTSDERKHAIQLAARTAMKISSEELSETTPI